MFLQEPVVVYQIALVLPHARGKFKQDCCLINVAQFCASLVESEVFSDIHSFIYLFTLSRATSLSQLQWKRGTQSVVTIRSGSNIVTVTYFLQSIRDINFEQTGL